MPIMAKGNRSIIYLVSSAGTGYYYTTSKNRRSQQEKLKMKKFDPIARKHVVFEEKSKV
jgi:large subunit ribosomal protein L33